MNIKTADDAYAQLIDPQFEIALASELSSTDDLLEPLVEWLELHEEVKKGYISISLPVYSDTVKKIISQIGDFFDINRDESVDFLNKYAKKAFEYIYGSRYNSLLETKKGKNRGAVENFNLSSDFKDVWGKGEFSPPEAFQLLLRLNLPLVVAYRARAYWESLGEIVKSSDINLVAITYNATKTLEIHVYGTLWDNIRAFVPIGSYRHRADPEVDAINYLKTYWGNAIDAGITQQVLNEIDPDILPAVRDQVARLKKQKQTVPKFKWPRIQRPFPDPSHSEVSGGVDAAERREKDRARKAAWRARQKIR